MATSAFQQATPTDKMLIGVAVAQIPEGFLRTALRAYEGVLGPDKPNVVSLVRDKFIQRAPEAYAAGRRAAELLRQHKGEVYGPPIPAPTPGWRAAPPGWQPDDPYDPVA